MMSHSNSSGVISHKVSETEERSSHILLVSLHRLSSPIRSFSSDFLSLCLSDGRRRLSDGLHVGWFCCLSAWRRRRCLRIELLIKIFPSRTDAFDVTMDTAVLLGRFLRLRKIILYVFMSHWWTGFFLLALQAQHLTFCCIMLISLDLAQTTFAFSAQLPPSSNSSLCSSIHHIFSSSQCIRLIMYLLCLVSTVCFVIKKVKIWREIYMLHLYFNLRIYRDYSYVKHNQITALRTL